MNVFKYSLLRTYCTKMFADNPVIDNALGGRDTR